MNTKGQKWRTTKDKKSGKNKRFMVRTISFYGGRHKQKVSFDTISLAGAQSDAENAFDLYYDNLGSDDTRTSLKRALVSVSNKAKSEGNKRISKMYEKVYKLMRKPKSGKNKKLRKIWDDERLGIGGFSGTIEATYEQLEKEFGTPDFSVTKKSQASWYLVDNETKQQVSIYDYKDYDKNIDEIKAWNIGGTRQSLVEALEGKGFVIRDSQGKIVKVTDKKSKKKQDISLVKKRIMMTLNKQIKQQRTSGKQFETRDYIFKKIKYQPQLKSHEGGSTTYTVTHKPTGKKYKLVNHIYRAFTYQDLEEM